MLKKLLFFSLFILFSEMLFAQPPVKPIAKGVVNGAAVSLPKPAYPAAAQAVKASGEVKIQVTIDEEGNVIAANAVSGHPLLRQTAERAARLAKFKPTTLEGVAVKISGIIIYNFVPAPEPAATAHPDEIWMLGMIFALLERVDDELLKQLDIDVKKGLIDLANNLPQEISKEKPLIEKLAKSKGAELQRLAGEIGKSLEKYFTAKELAVYQTGWLLGAVIGESFKTLLALITDENAKIETARLKTDLAAFRDKLNFSKPNVSPEVAAGFGELAAMADADLNAPVNIKKLFGVIEKILDLVSFEEEEPEENAPAPSKNDT